MIAAPVLSGPPAFVLLAVAIALAAYLRQLSEAREKLLEEIAKGERNWKYPVGRFHTQEKIKHLKSSRDKLTGIAPVLIWLTMVIGLRLLLLAIASLFEGFAAVYNFFDRVFRWMDLLIIAWVFSALIVLWRMHIRGRQADEKIDLLTQAWFHESKEPTIRL